ncbi:hypothetical protein [Lentilactobacillus diolivorans]|nr:hypothetical protein [Lentilactobacillus diolivorans]GEP25342.1 hypothetical protein LDI01_29350 [Lentilactobacillus diolivorans]
MKKGLTTACLLVLLPLGLFGCSSNAGDKGSSSSSSSSQSSQAASSSTSQSSSTTATNRNQGSQKAEKIRYQNVRYTTRLDNEYREEQIYKYVPGSVRNNKIYDWNTLHVSDQQKVYVSEKAVATFKDRDDNELEHEDFYRIRFSRSNTAQKYWVNDDVIENERNEAHDD